MPNLPEGFHWLIPILQLIVAVVLALPIAWDRERHARNVGLRTFPLVSLGACAYVLIGLLAFDQGSDANARLLQGLMTGIGFIGGGAILKHDDKVSGTASAASIWVTGAIGALVAYQQWTLAVSLSLVNLGIVVGLSRVKAELE